MGFWGDGFFYPELCLVLVNYFLRWNRLSVRTCMLPALSGKCAFSDAKRQLISLPSHLGGLGITDPCVSSAFQFDAS